MTARESLNHDYGRLAGFLRSISLRFQLLATLEFLLLLPSGCFVVLLGSFFAFELKKIFPYLPFIYSLLSFLFLFILLLLAPMEDRLETFHGTGGKKSGGGVSPA